MPWYYAVAERDHEIQNPTSAEKIELLGTYLRLDPAVRVLDLACGKGGPAVRPGGYVVVGEPYWRHWPLPRGIDDQGFVALRETVGRIESAGLSLQGMIASSEDDWDRYESLHWRALDEWLAANPRDPDASEIRERHERNRDDYLSFQRELLGWAIFIARKPYT